MEKVNPNIYKVDIKPALAYNKDNEFNEPDFVLIRPSGSAHEKLSKGATVRFPCSSSFFVVRWGSMIIEDNRRNILWLFWNMIS